MAVKLYKEMTASEQLQWVKEFSEFADNDLRVLAGLKGAWNVSHRKMMERGLRLINAFPYAQSYVRDTLRYGDYHRRAYRLQHYVTRIKKDISRSVTVTDAEGNSFAYVPQLRQEQRRRGRPTREETYRRKIMLHSGETDIEAEKQQHIARLLGLEVITDPVGREKNNDELKAEREARSALETKMNPGLFDDGNEDAVIQQQTEHEETSEGGDGPTLMQQTKPMGHSAIAEISQARLHMDQLSWLLTPDLRERVSSIRDLRSTAASYAEQAKVMAERGDKSEVIEPVAKLAAKYTELYEKIYEDVDKELAVVYYRLKYDEPYTEKFKKRYRVKDTDSIRKELKPYYQKMVPGFDEYVKTIIEQESPEYIERQKAEKARKAEVEAIIKYLRRKDKNATKKRVETARAKFARLVVLMGEDQADTYKPLLDLIERDYNESIKK